MVQRRVVDIIILDVDYDIPVEDAVLYKKSGLVTDCTDEELYFNLELKKLLDTHNTLRSTYENEGSVRLKELRLADLYRKITTIHEI